MHVPFGYGGGGVDAQLYQAPIKAMQETGTRWTNPRMGAPGNSNLYDHPMPEGLHFATIWLFLQLTGDWAVAYNLFLLVHFPLGALSATWVLRRLAAGVPGSVVGGVLFAYLPHHAIVMSSQHVFLGAYFPIPLAMLVAVRLFEGQLVVLSRRGLGAASVGVLLGATGAYYAVFACAFFAIAGLANAMRRRSVKAVLPAVMCVTVVIVSLAVNLAPTFAYRQEHGQNKELRRYIMESNFWALRVSELVLPSAHHRHPLMAHVAENYTSKFDPTVTAEGALYVPLGIIGAVGLIAALLAVLRKESDADGHQPAYTRLLISALLIAVPGGFGPLFNFVVTPWIRCYHRLCVFIGFLALATAVRLFDCLFPPEAGVWRRRLAYLSAAGLLAFGLYDQTPRPLYPPYSERAAEFDADRQFVNMVEATLPEGVAVFQLPYTPYPEGGPVHEMYDYAHTRGYLHSAKLRWSYGAVKGRPMATRQQQTSELPPGKFLEEITANGFDAVWVDRFGYPHRNATIETDLAKVADGPPLVSENGRFAVYALTRYRQSREKSP